jgi:hypothetical protein
MKTLSLLAAAAAALSLGLAAGASAKTPYKPNPGPISSKPVQPHAMKYLNCRVKPLPAGARLDISPIVIMNTSGVTLKAGKVIYVHYTGKNGIVNKTSFVLKTSLAPGATTEILGGGVRCTAQVDLIG